MVNGQKVVCTIKVRQDRKPLRFEGTVIRVDPPQDGWEAGIVVHYPKVKFRGEPCAIFHEWPSSYVQEA